MRTADAEPHLAEPDAATLVGLRDALKRADYTESRTAAALGSRPPLQRTRREVYRRRLSAAGDLGTLVRLFRLGDPIARDDAAAALAPTDVGALVEAGILDARDDAVVAAVELSPYEGLFLAHDRLEAEEAPASWHVIFGSASRTLAALTIRRPIRLALDLGTGCGVQALLAARHAEHVIATDLADRALTFTRINAALNGAGNVECRQGDLFAPVEGERFGLIASNPPFVISPEAELVFRDSGLPGDEISRRVVAGAAEHLEDCGHATILCNWIRSPDDHWSTAPRGWLKHDCDALLLQFTSVAPLEYAAMWTDEFDRWLAYYAEEEIEAISTGAVVLRRTDLGGRVIAYQANSAPKANAGEQFLRIFAADEAVAANDERLLGEHFRLVDHRLRQEASYRDGAYTVELTGVEIRGMPLNARVEAEAVHVLARLDDSTSLADVIDRTARETGLERQALERATLMTVRRLYERGFLVLSRRSRP
jgi:methylase of polypeptide subunit release factors